MSKSYVFDPDRVFRAHVLEIIDGDTVDMAFDCGFYNTHVDRIRLYGIDTPETYGVKKDSTEYAAGQAAKDFVGTHLLPRIASGQQVWVETVKRGKFGRYLGIVWISRDDVGDVGKSLNARLLDAGHATLYKAEPLPLGDA